ncbi:MAG: protein translocase subunit SecF [Candidatus Buchananbacteria bacterium]|nr:protein translocase subunit SecF [Candidatus Buchananbacteria bacterium]
MFSIIKSRKIWFTLSATLVIASSICFSVWGLDFGIDFTGGSLLELQFNTQRPSSAELNTILEPLNLGSITVQPVGDQNVILRFTNVDEKTHQTISQILEDKLTQQLADPSQINNQSGVKIFEEVKFSSIGPTIGSELKQKTIWAIIIVLIAIIIYVAWAFRKVSKPVASWKYGLIAVLALFHDLIITIGFFVVFGQIYGLEVNAPFVAALLTILGYSVNDTIVVFDRTRENLTKHLGKDFDDVVDESINQTMRRSINTSLTTIIVLFAVLLFGGSTIRDFVLALIIGIAVGTYSSIFLASPLLVTWQKFGNKRN